MIGIMSDAHGNLNAFNRGLSILEDMGANSFVFLGDAVGYFPGDKVVQQLSSAGSRFVCVRGNHDEMLIERSWPKGAEPVYQLEKTAKLSDSSTEAVLKSWLEFYRLTTKSGDALFVHGGPRDPTNQYVYLNTPLEEIETDARFVFMGHTHRPFVRQTVNTLFVNVGSCGLPRDHGTLGSVCLFDPTEGTANIIRYDISDIMSNALQSGDLHVDVSKLFTRQPKSYYGNFYRGKVK